jgi:predicted ArsR family transcriptional regulator
VLRPEDDAQIDSLSLLRDPLRRAIYRYVAHAPEPVGRDEVGTAVGASRTLVAFHLYKLEAEGLLCTIFRRLSGRSGTGGGRPAKLYARSDRQLAVSLPAREYELAAPLLLRAVDGPNRPVDRLKAAARELGEATGAKAAELGGPPRGRAATLDLLAGVLEQLGYAPFRDRGSLRLRNCPFHSLAEQSTETVCGMNLALIDGVLQGLRAKGVAAALAPEPGRCCVEVARRPA